MHRGKPVPHDMRALVYIRDGEMLWYQRLLDPLLRPGDWTKLLVDLTEDSADQWKAVGHSQAKLGRLVSPGCIPQSAMTRVNYASSG